MSGSEWQVVGAAITDDRDRHRGRVARRRGLVGVVASVVGLATAATPLLRWIAISLDPVHYSVTGFGTERISVSSGGFDLSSQTRQSIGNETGWILRWVPDGATVTVLGLLAAWAGVQLLRRTLRKDAGPGRQPGAVRSSATLLVVGLAGVGWTAWSWLRVDRTWDRARHDATLDELDRAVLAATKVSPGLGLVLAGVAMAVIAALGFAGVMAGVPPKDA